MAIVKTSSIGIGQGSKIYPQSLMEISATMGSSTQYQRKWSRMF